MLTLQNINFSYPQKKVLQDLSLSLQSGEILAVMGESGCGKSTLLHLIAGLKRQQSGRMENRFQRVAYVFQEPRLFPWLTVSENLKAVLNERDPDQSKKIADALALVSLVAEADQFPDALSGGMKSRVALARALVYAGDLYLLDEPFAALNEELRDRLALALRAKIKADGAAAILVTHNPTDAKLLADRIITL